MKPFSYFLLLILLISATSSVAQKQSLEGDVSRFVCASDSIKYLTLQNLKANGVDSILCFLYDYDNGRMEEAVHYFLWIEAGKEKMKIINGCDKIIVKDYTLTNQVSFLFALYKSKKLEEPRRRIPNQSSHGMGYSVSNKLFTKPFSGFRVRDDVRNVDDPRVFFVNEFDRLIVSKFGK